MGSPSPQPWGSPSPSYADGDAHGGFNPNVTFPHGHPAQRTPSPAFTSVQYPPYNYSPPAYASSPTPPLRRCALPFSHLGDTDETETDMDDIIAEGSAATAASPGFTADEAVDLSGGMDGELGYVYGNEEQEEELATVSARRRKKKKRTARSDEPRIKWVSKEEEFLAEAWKVLCLDPEEEEPAPVPTKGRQKKKKRAARSGEPRIKWTSKEEECLAEAWKVVCLDPTTGTNQSIETYWERIKAEFDERKLVDPYFKGVYMQRGSKAMANHWGRIHLEHGLHLGVRLFLNHHGSLARGSPSRLHNGKSSASTRPPARTRASRRTGSASRPSLTSASSSTPTLKASTCSAAPRRWRTIGGVSSWRATNGMESSRRSRLARRAAPALRIRYGTPVSRLSSPCAPANCLFLRAAAAYVHHVSAQQPRRRLQAPPCLQAH